MYRARSKRAERRRLILTYTLVPIFVAGVVALLVFYMLGYRFSLADHTVSQGGLLQFASQPGGANVTIDTYRLATNTPTRYDASAGLHTVTMRQDGYIPWQKTVTVEPGKVLWLNYARLIPEQIKQTSLARQDSLAGSLASVAGQLIITLPDASKPALERIALGDTIQRSTISIPAKLLKSGVTQSRFALAAVSKTGRYAVVKHSYEKAYEWLLIDSQSPDRSRNLTTIIGRATDMPLFAASSEQKLYTLVDHDLRLVDASAETLSAPIIRDIAEISQSTDGAIAYVTRASGTPSQRVAGYYVPGSAAPHVVRTFYDDGRTTLRLRIGSFSGDTYLVLQYGATIEINATRRLVASSDETLQLTSIATLAVPDGADTVDFSPSGRFVVSQRAATYLTYDLELNSLSTTSLKGESSGKQPLGWLDSYIVWSDRGGVLNLYEFDGANNSTIGAVMPGQAIVLSSDGKYIYAFQATADGTATELVRFHLRIN